MQCYIHNGVVYLRCRWMRVVSSHISYSDGCFGQGEMMKQVLVVCAMLVATTAHASHVGASRGNHGPAGLGPAGGQAAAGQASNSSASASSSGSSGQSEGNGSVVLGYCDVAHYSICYKE